MMSMGSASVLFLALGSIWQLVRPQPEFQRVTLDFPQGRKAPLLIASPSPRVKVLTPPTPTLFPPTLLSNCHLFFPHYQFQKAGLRPQRQKRNHLLQVQSPSISKAAFNFLFNVKHRRVKMHISERQSLPCSGPPGWAVVQSSSCKQPTAVFITVIYFQEPVSQLLSSRILVPGSIVMPALWISVWRPKS